MKYTKYFRLVYTELGSNFFCCPGWTQVSHLSFGCNRRKSLAFARNTKICILLFTFCYKCKFDLRQN